MNPSLETMLFIWVASICATGMLAGRKGRSSAVWAAAAALLSPLVFVVLLIVPSAD